MLIPEGEAKEFLGQEFLTWLWFYGENNDWTMTLANGELLRYGMDEMLTLEPEGTGCSQKLSGPVPTNSPEAQISLREGKKVSATRLVLVCGDNEWSVTIRGNTFDFSTLKLMKPTTSDVDDRFAELSEDLELAMQLFDGMYQIFLEVRLAPYWQERELPAMQEWAASK